MPTPDEIDQTITAAANQYNLPPDLFRKQLQAESNLNPAATGAGGELGIAQFTPDTAKAFGIDPLDYKQAVPAAAHYMRQNLNRFGGDYTKALAAYNWGPGNVARNGVANLPPVTQAYIQKIMGPGGPGQAVGTPPQAAPAPVPQAPVPAAPVPQAPVPAAPVPQAPVPGAAQPPPDTLASAFTAAAGQAAAASQDTQGPAWASQRTQPPPLPMPPTLTPPLNAAPFQVQPPAPPAAPVSAQQRRPVPFTRPPTGAPAAPAPPFPAITPTPGPAGFRPPAGLTPQPGAAPQPGTPTWAPPPAAPSTDLSGVIMRALRGY